MSGFLSHPTAWCVVSLSCYSLPYIRVGWDMGYILVVYQDWSRLCLMHVFTMIPCHLGFEAAEYTENNRYWEHCRRWDILLPVRSLPYYSVGWECVFSISCLYIFIYLNIMFFSVVTRGYTTGWCWCVMFYSYLTDQYNTPMIPYLCVKHHTMIFGCVDMKLFDSFVDDNIL